MEGLVVVHVTEGYTNPEQMSIELATRLSGVFWNISRKIESYLESGYLVYHILGSFDLYPSFKKFADHDRFICIPRNIPDEAQFLLTKGQVILDGISSVEICGVARQLCVQDVYDVFRGGISRKNEGIWRKNSSSLNWSDEKFYRILHRSLDSRIIEELC